MSPTNPSRAWATLLTKNDYLPGVLVLLQGLRTVKSKYPLVVMAPPKLSLEARDVLKRLGVVVRDVEYLQNDGGGFVDVRFGEVWTKIRVWELLEYERVVLIDSDVVIRRNMDELFDIELAPGHIAASHVCACNPRKIPYFPKDWIPTNCAHTYVPTPHSPPPDPTPTPTSPRPFTQLNSGVVVLTPCTKAFNELLHILTTKPDEVKSYIFADQDLITSVFQGRWKALPWYYNALRTLESVHPQLWEAGEVRCIHYILFDKPWHSRLMLQDKVFGGTNKWWWDTWDGMVEEMKESLPGVGEFVGQYVDFEKDWRP